MSEIQQLHTETAPAVEERAIAIVRRFLKAARKKHWEEGESLEEACDEASEFLVYVGLRKEIMCDPVPVGFTADNVCLPDLRGRPHFCDHQP